MPISVDWPTAVITIPQSYMTPLGGGVYELDIDQFRLDLGDLLDDSDGGMPWPTAYTHDAEKVISGLIYARAVIVVPPYTVEITPPGGWVVSCVGANHNVQDVYTNLTGPTFLPNNAAGLIRTTVPAEPTEAHVAAAFNAPTNLLRLSIWLERLGSTVVAPISCQIDWYNPDGSLLFTLADVSPDAQGVFVVERASTPLLSNVAYYARVSVTDASGLVSTIRGVPTGP